MVPVAADPSGTSTLGGDRFWAGVHSGCDGGTPRSTACVALHPGTALAPLSRRGRDAQALSHPSGLGSVRGSSLLNREPCHAAEKQEPFLVLEEEYSTSKKEIRKPDIFNVNPRKISSKPVQ